MHPIPRFATLAAGLIALGSPAMADEVEVPYWAAIDVSEINMRVGPGQDYRILWVYRRKQLPLRVLRVKEGWRLVEDPDGAQGWVLGQFLTRARGAIVTGKQPADMREAGNAGARVKWRLEPGVTGALGSCEQGWCAFDVAGHKGFVAQDRLWGPGEP